ncbi:glutamate synthase (NADH) large subunit [Natranaerovirga hydrolytica]|uniref:Glutamate synthase (NADH) large subunit n=1 Tax=Natranaerovirga hydrolytica TaxID=680378 RepID=A0A4R1MNG6_9FIRM|nr:glutamate synthase large subunit [Natranaerovirga hydrolytica]TCK92844.1 glutamate synthase (NADH) large subunit [Natranaerovirga hydrolytica]
MLEKKYGLPSQQGLYDPAFEKDNCGVGFVSHMKGKKSHEIVSQGLDILVNLTHRGAVGADPDSGDGAGIMIQIPHKFLTKQTESLGFSLPKEGEYGVGMVFLPQEPNARFYIEGVFERILEEENLRLLGWRNVPIVENATGLTARGTHPVIHQLFVAKDDYDTTTFNRKLFIVRKLVEKAIHNCNKPYMESFYVCSFSNTTMIYKGQLLAHQIPDFFPDLKDKDMESAIALVHQRYSTNTFPSWDRAQPFRYLAHNGEINTLRGNVNWMNAREGILNSDVLGEDIKKIYPIISPNGSDSSNLDNALELLLASGKSLAQAMCILIPEAWQKDENMNPDKKGFYEYHAGLMEPWDGPAAIAFTDGIQIGATLDRNGLRPARYLVTKDDIVVMASETGVLPFEPNQILIKGRLEPGKMFLIDTKEGRIISDKEIKETLSKDKPYKKWIAENKLTLNDLPLPHEISILSEDLLLNNQKLYNYSEEELKRILAPMAEDGKEALGSMGNDAPLAVLSDESQLLFNYFRQLFAQVTNPPIDPIREELVMSLTQFLGDRDNLLNELDPTIKHNFIELKQPILDNANFEKIRHIDHADFRTTKIPMLFPVNNSGRCLKNALDSLCQRVVQSIEDGYNIIILSDRNVDKYNAPIPSLLALSCVHQHLIKEKLRTKVDLIVETGDARDVMHMALLLGYGANAVNPYVAIDSICHLLKDKLYINKDITQEDAIKNYITALSKGILKVLSKMGICTLQSYQGAQIFEAVGISKKVIDRYFTGTPSRIEGIDLEIIAQEVMLRHESAFKQLRNPYKNLLEGGAIHWRKNRENHLFNPDSIHKLQHACRTKDYNLYKEYANIINDQSIKLGTIRGMLDFKNTTSIPLEEVEPLDNIVKRFATGAMSFGSLSKEVHETLAVAMNRIGGKSNSGEGGEDATRYELDINGDSKKSAIKQIASGRFGVTTEYLVNAEELQIKMAQGAKPGEGGHLPGHKVSKAIAKVRHSTPGIDLISPPPHHDIYSIEDLAQLIYDLKNVNPLSRVNVKLVSEVGVGTVAAGVAKGHADVILISGHDGGTGASPISSIKYAGLPWELGLAEAQQTLLLNDLRGRVVLQTDGQLKTGRDIAIAALLGAEEFGFATAALVVCGCIMMRKCHKNTCPVGVATQDPELRKYYQGKPEHLINFFTFLANDLREIMAELGIRTLDEMIGRVDLLETKEDLNHWKGKTLDLSSVLYKPELPSRIKPRKMMDQDHGLDTILDRTLIKDALPALENQEKVQKTYDVRNINRTVGTMLSGEVAKRYGANGLEDDSIHLKFNGTAGQSFACFGMKGITFELEGDCNDYLGKGLSGAKVIVYPPVQSTFIPQDNILVGNTLLYGATSGEVYINGVAGERFAVRNSGASAVVEGVGDHGCEYMTGGVAVILGETGRNFGAGMSGGMAFVLDEKEDFVSKRCNTQLVLTETVESDDDIDLLKSLITNHYSYTNSKKAKEILDHWESSLPKFIKVISPAYKKVLQDKKSADEVAVAN